MGFFDTLNDDKFVISLERPCKYSGYEILEAIKLTISNLVDKEINGEASAEEIEIKKWLSRLERVVSRDTVYRLTIDEAVKIGLLV